MKASITPACADGTFRSMISLSCHSAADPGTAPVRGEEEDAHRTMFIWFGEVLISVITVSLT